MAFHTKRVNVAVIILSFDSFSVKCQIIKVNVEVIILSFHSKRVTVDSFSVSGYSFRVKLCSLRIKPDVKRSIVAALQIDAGVFYAVVAIILINRIALVYLFQNPMPDITQILIFVVGKNNNNGVTCKTAGFPAKPLLTVEHLFLYPQRFF